MLPEWAETNNINGCYILYGGFNPRWAAGHAEREVVNRLANRLGTGYAVVVPTWYDPIDVVQYINQLDVKQVYICSLTDPFGPITGFESSINCEVKYFGYTPDNKFDFWAYLCNSKFKKYNNKDLLPTEFNHLFLNYNRKPHGHRIGLVTELEQNNLLEYGIVTLGEKYAIKETDDYKEYGSDDVVDNIKIPNDIYSLGRLDIWQRHFLNIVSETEFTPTSYFLSEKTFKPIIGLRPFIINGNPKIYSWLLDAGFDCFEDIFPINKLQQQTNTYQTHQLITSVIKDLLNSDLNSLYQKIYSRCLYNQNHFYEYAKSFQNS
jgi:hypothetical protein